MHFPGHFLGHFTGHWPPDQASETQLPKVAKGRLSNGNHGIYVATMLPFCGGPERWMSEICYVIPNAKLSPNDVTRHDVHIIMI